MTRDEVKRIFMLLKAVFPNFLPETDDERKVMLGIWEKMFERNSYSECEWAAMRCIESCTFPPTVADMKSYLGMGRTLDDVRAALPFKQEEPQFANEITIQAGYERAMRMLNTAPSFRGNAPQQKE